MIYKTEAGKREILRRYEQNLTHWPVPAEHRRVPTREGDTFVLVCGPEEAPPLLLLHGSGSNASMWMGDVPAWAEHFRVHAIDMIGEPGLSAPSRPPLDSPAYALWLDDVLDHLGLDRAAVTGASLGGWLALDYATRRPERVEKLALLCPGVRRSPSSSKPCCTNRSGSGACAGRSRRSRASTPGRHRRSPSTSR